jgi:hypothetical protein
MWPVKSTSPATAAQAEAMTCARRPPPSSRARSPVSGTVVPAARAEGMRSTVSGSGAISLITRATGGVSGPWSA